MSSGEVGSGEAGSGDAGSGDAGTDGSADGSADGQSTGPGEPICGDGVPEGDEACDDGLNDGSYEGCTADCQFAAYCGDTNLDASSGEACDDGNEDLTDGCLPNCVVPRSCLEIREAANAPADGIYLIDPADNTGAPFEAYCDMTTDGGGYTFYKVETDDGVFAPEAELRCGEMGMQLLIPRTKAHRDSAWSIGVDPDISPGGGTNYLRILGVYPVEAGATCVSQALTSQNPTCHWRASDDQTFWVDDRGLFNEPNGNGGATMVNASIRYDWGDGELDWYDDVSGAGGSSSQFMCHVGDKY